MQISDDVIQMCMDWVRVEAAIDAAWRWARGLHRRLRPPSVSALCSSGCSKVSKVEEAPLTSVEYSL
jgi:hypothetical protein